MRRALPTLLTSLVVVGLLAAGVLASSEDEQRERKQPASPLALMRNAPSELEPQLEDFEPKPTPPARRKPPESR